MTTYVQRQFSGFLSIGTATDPVTVGLTSRAWELQDVYPSNILKLEPGLFSTTTARIDAALSTTHTASLPSSYTSASRLSFTLRTDQNIRVSVVSPDHPDSVCLVYVPAGQFGFYSVVQTVTSIKIVNISASDATIEYCCFQYPDLTSADSWRDGYQTLGVIST